MSGRRVKIQARNTVCMSEKAASIPRTNKGGKKNEVN